MARLPGLTPKLRERIVHELADGVPVLRLEVPNRGTVPVLEQEAPFVIDCLRVRSAGHC